MLGSILDDALESGLEIQRQTLAVESTGGEAAGLNPETWVTTRPPDSPKLSLLVETPNRVYSLTFLAEDANSVRLHIFVACGKHNEISFGLLPVGKYYSVGRNVVDLLALLYFDSPVDDEVLGRSGQIVASTPLKV